LLILCIAVAGLVFGCNDEPGVITESSLSYTAPQVNSVQVQGFEAGMMTLQWNTNKPSRCFVQISEDGAYGPTSSTEKKCLVLENTYETLADYQGNDYSSIIRVDQSLQRGALQTVTTVQCATSEVFGGYFSMLNVQGNGLAKTAVLPSRVLDIAYVQIVDRLKTGALLSEAFVKVSLDKTNFDPSRLSAAAKAVYESMSTWTMGNSSYSSPYIDNPANFDLQPFLDAGMRVEGETVFTSHSSDGAATARDHKCTIRGLTAGKDYYIRIVAFDSWGNTTIGPIRLIRSISRRETYSMTIAQPGGTLTIPGGPGVTIAAGQLQWSAILKMGYLEDLPEKVDSPSIFGKGCYVIMPVDGVTATLTMPKGDFPSATQIYSWSFEKGYTALNTSVSGQSLQAQITGDGYYFLGNG